MKANDTKTANTPVQAKKSGASPFFSQEKGDSVLEQSQPFFGETSRGSFFSPPPVQAKLTIGAPDDPYEKEADVTAEKVVQRLAQPDAPALSEPVPSIQRMPAPVQRACAECENEDNLQKKEDEDAIQEKVQRKPIFDAPNDAEGPVQRKCGACAEEESEAPVQRKADASGATSAPANFSAQLQSSKGGGAPLPADVNDSMSQAMGADFSGVRVHTGSEAAEMSQSIQAQAFTHGSDIYFNEGKYDTGSMEGQKLLAHELTHTVQQGGAGVAPKVQKEEVCEPQPAEEQVCMDPTFESESTVCESPEEPELSSEEMVENDQVCYLEDSPIIQDDYIGEFTQLYALVKAEQGIRLHTTPDTNDYDYKNLLGKAEVIYPRYEEVEVIAKGNDKHKGWVKVKTIDSQEGWIEEYYIEYIKKGETGVWKYYFIEKGDKLITLIQRDYYDIFDIKYGQDERAVAQAFAILNQGNPAIYMSGDYESSFWKDDLLDGSMEGARKTFHEIKLYEGRLLKFPTGEYIHGLIKQGKVSSRAGWKNAIFKVGRSIQGFLTGVVEGFIGAAIDTIVGLWDLVKSIVTGSIIDQAEALYDQISNLGWKGLWDLLKEAFLGEIIALQKFIEGVNPEKKWWAIGKVVGMIVFEVVLAIFTAGIGTALKTSARVGKVLSRVSKITSKIPGIGTIKKGKQADLNKVDFKKRKDVVENYDKKKSDVDVNADFQKALLKARVLTEAYDAADMNIASLEASLSIIKATHKPAVKGYDIKKIREPNHYEVIQRAVVDSDYTPAPKDSKGSTKLVPGSAAHKSQRWIDYQMKHPDRFPEISETIDPKWSKQYDTIIENGKAGRGFEKEALGHLKKNKNDHVFIDDNNPEKGFIPDSIEGDPDMIEWGKPYHFTEVKGWENMSNTGNLAQMLAYVEKVNGSKITAVFRSAKHAKGKTELSGPLRTRLLNLIAEGRAEIVYYP